MANIDMNLFHETMRRGRFQSWRDRSVIKFPEDMTLYAKVIHDLKPDTIIETGTAYGGSSMFFGDLLQLFNPTGQVITVDVQAAIKPDHPLVTYIEGNSASPEIADRIKSMVRGKTMVILDSSHKARHVMREMSLYWQLVTVGQYMVVEDAFRGSRLDQPSTAIAWFLKHVNLFTVDPVPYRMFSGVTRGGWMKRNG